MPFCVMWHGFGVACIMKRMTRSSQFVSLTLMQVSGISEDSPFFRDNCAKFQHHVDEMKVRGF